MIVDGICTLSDGWTPWATISDWALCVSKASYSVSASVTGTRDLAWLYIFWRTILVLNSYNWYSLCTVFCSAAESGQKKQLTLCYAPSTIVCCSRCESCLRSFLVNSPQNSSNGQLIVSFPKISMLILHPGLGSLTAFIWMLRSLLQPWPGAECLERGLLTLYAVNCALSTSPLEPHPQKMLLP